MLQHSWSYKSPASCRDNKELIMSLWHVVNLSSTVQSSGTVRKALLMLFCWPQSANEYNSLNFQPYSSLFLMYGQLPAQTKDGWPFSDIIHHQKKSVARFDCVGGILFHGYVSCNQVKKKTILWPTPEFIFKPEWFSSSCWIFKLCLQFKRKILLRDVTKIMHIEEHETCV